ncbi:MAG TPA: SIMPL domain-containing protein [Verrucomicrobiota bacterium]|nr:SIMPL domain-containing protein [Verrucomicrobiales bacterium]HRI11449.1 SIMPL domain-containing protein [Verrucomicrobiota bacterium]
MTNPSRPQLFGLLAGIFLAGGLVLASMVVTRAWLKVAEPQTISVTGSSRRTVHSDLIIWRAGFSTEAASLLEAQNTLKVNRVKVGAFLATQGVTNAIVSSIAITPLKHRGGAGESDSPTTGYRLSQTIEIRSPEVARTLGLDQASMALVEDGVAFVPTTPQFVYTGAADAKIEMLAEATRDARQRADQIAREGGRRVKELRSARMGVFQITPLHSSEVSWDGMNDTTAPDKTITSVVNAQFTIE